jgi:hypothetical protein
MTCFMRLFNCVLLLLLTGAATLWLCSTIEPWLAPDQWDAKLTFVFICVLWPMLTWSLRSVTRTDPADPYSMLWWW